MSLVSVVTPTKPERIELLFDRCIPSVMALDWPEVEHVIVSDPNPDLVETLREVDLENVLWRPGFTIRYAEINDTWRNGVKDRSIGAVPWHIGSLMALGDYVAFLGDDDELLPDHVSRHVAALQDFDFSVSPIQFRVGGQDWAVIGDALACGHLDATGIMCRREALRTANWTADGTDAADWRLVRDWMAAGLKGTLLGGTPTGVHNDGWAARQ